MSNYRECNYNIEIINDNVCQIRCVLYEISIKSGMEMCTIIL